MAPRKGGPGLIVYVSLHLEACFFFLYNISSLGDDTVAAPRRILALRSNGSAERWYCIQILPSVLGICTRSELSRDAAQSAWPGCKEDTQLLWYVSSFVMEGRCTLR